MEFLIIEFICNSAASIKWNFSILCEWKIFQFGPDL